MKTRLFFTIILLTIFVMNATAQDTLKDCVWKYNGKNKEQTIGLFAGLNGKFTEVSGRPAGWMGGRIGVVFNRKFAVGLAGYSLSYNYNIKSHIINGTYHMASGYGGVYFEYLQPLGKYVKLGASLLAGRGNAEFTYSEECGNEKAWQDRTVNTYTYTVIEPGIEAMVRIAPKWWVGVNASYPGTSSIRFPETPSTLFNTFHAGVSLTFGLF